MNNNEFLYSIFPFNKNVFANRNYILFSSQVKLGKEVGILVREIFT